VARVESASKIYVPKGVSLEAVKSARGKRIDFSCYQVKDVQKARALGRGQKVKVIGWLADAKSGSLRFEPSSITPLEPNPTRVVTSRQLSAEFAKGEEEALKKYVARGKEQEDLLVEGPSPP